MSETFFNLAWLIPLPTLIAFFLIILFTNRNKRLNSNIALVGVFTAWLLSWTVAFIAFFGAEVVAHPFDVSVPWIPTGETTFSMGVMVVGKFFVFAAVINQQLLVVAVVAAINVVIGAACYLNIVRYMAFRPSEDDTPITLSGGLKTALIIAAAMVLVIGIAAQPFITWATESANSMIASIF